MCRFVCGRVGKKSEYIYSIYVDWMVMGEYCKLLQGKTIIEMVAYSK